MTAAQELGYVDAALQAAYQANASAYTIDARSKTLLDITKLIERKKELELIIARQSNGGFAAVQFTHVI